MGPHLKSQLLITFCSHTTPKTNCLLWKNADYFASSDPHHDISKLLVDTTFVWNFCHGTFAQLTIPIICFTWQVIVHISLSNRIKTCQLPCEVNSRALKRMVCLNMTKQASGPPEPNKQTCPNMSAHCLCDVDCLKRLCKQLQRYRSGNVSVHPSDSVICSNWLLQTLPPAK